MSVTRSRTKTYKCEAEQRRIDVTTACENLQESLSRFDLVGCKKHESKEAIREKKLSKIYTKYMFKQNSIYTVTESHWFE